MVTRSHLSSWEYLVEPLEYELRHLGGAGVTIAAQTAMYHQSSPSGHETTRHERILLEELTNLRGPLQRATEYVNQMIHELEAHSWKRRRLTENLAVTQTSRNESNAHQMGAEEDEWKGAVKLFSKVALSQKKLEKVNLFYFCILLEIDWNIQII